MRGVTWWHGLVYHSHSAGWRHHTHQCPYRGTCSRGRLLLAWSLSFLLFHYFSCALCKQIGFLLTVVCGRQKLWPTICPLSPSYSVFLEASRFLHSVPTNRLSSPKEKSGCLALITARISLLNKMYPLMFIFLLAPSFFDRPFTFGVDLPEGERHPLKSNWKCTAVKIPVFVAKCVPARACSASYPCH